MKSEEQFIAELEQRAGEQRRLVESEMMPNWAKGMGEWLVVHPWRLLVPLALLAYGTWRIAHGAIAREFVLGLFGGF